MAPIDPGPGAPYWQREPARLSGQVSALLALLAACGLQISDQTTAAITSAAAGVATLLGFYLLRAKVTSPATRKQLDRHLDAAQNAASANGQILSMLAYTGDDVPAPSPPSRLHAMATTPTLEEVLSHHPKSLGRRPPKNAPALRFADHVAAIPPHPIADPPPGLSWPMDHNDTVGCCVVAGLDHFRQVVDTLLTGSYRGWSDAELLALYRTQNPGFKSWADAGGPDDNGMDIQTLLEHLVKTGVILGFAKVDHTNIDEIKAATDLDLGLVTGETLTRRNMSEQTWDYHANDPVEGGHCTVSVGYDPLEDQVSWGALYKMTDAFFAKRVEEAWFIITQAHVDHPGFRAGFNLASFAAAYKAITGKNFPVAVTPPQPAPTPTPGPSPAPGPDASFLEAVGAYSGLADWLAARADKKGMTPDDYAAWILAGEAHKR